MLSFVRSFFSSPAISPMVQQLVEGAIKDNAVVVSSIYVSEAALQNISNEHE
jgi:uncharacterized membrane protein YcfT